MNDVGRIRRFGLHKSPDDVNRSLRDLVRMAWRDVPFYSRTWNAANVDIREFRGVQDLTLLPLTMKTNLLSRGLEDRLVRGRCSKRCVSRVTSGMSGQDLEVYMSPAELRYRQVRLFFRMWREANYRLPLSVVQAGAWIPPANRGEVRTRRAPWGKVVHISRNLPIQTQIDAMVRAQPTVLTGCPSNLEMIATEMVSAGDDRVRPAVVVTRGEMLRPHVRTMLAEAFRSRVVDYYSAEEIGLIAWECPHVSGMMHVDASSCVLEIVDDSGQSVPHGSEGIVAVTNLFNATMPLIRYVLGDRTSMTRCIPSACHCGTALQTIQTPAGRIDDFLILPDRTKRSPRLIDDLVYLACSADGIDGPFTRSLRDYQIVQESETRIVFRFLTDVTVPDVMRNVLAKHLRALHEDLECELVSVSALEMMDSGKRKRVISHVLPAASREQRSHSGDPQALG